MVFGQLKSVFCPVQRETFSGLLVLIFLWRLLRVQAVGYLAEGN